VPGRNYCLAVKSLLGKDTEDACKEFSDFFFERVQREGLAASGLGPRIMPLIVWSPQDLSSRWRCLNKGCVNRKWRLISATFARAGVINCRILGG
jgi:hypothetical protein